MLIEKSDMFNTQHIKYDGQRDAHGVHDLEPTKTNSITMPSLHTIQKQMPSQKEQGCAPLLMSMQQSWRPQGMLRLQLLLIREIPWSL